MDLKMFLATVKLYWKTFVITTVAGLAVGLAWLALTPQQYVSTTQLLVSINGSTTATAYQNDDIVTGRVNSYIALLTSNVVSQRVVDKLGLPLTPAEFAAKVSATNVPPKTSVIDIAVTDPSPAQAQRLADTLAREFVSYTDALETPTGGDGQKVHTTVVTAASQPRSRHAERIALGVLVGLAALVLGGVAVWIRSLTDPVVRAADRAAAAAGVPVLGYVTSAPAASLDALEGYRRLRHRLRSMASAGEARVSMLASAIGEVDASVVASNLGRVTELGGSHSIVLDADFADAAKRSPSEDAGGSPSDTGESWAKPARASEGFPDTLSTSVWATQPDEVTKAAPALVERLRRDYDEVIFAAPPVLSTLTASALSEHADAVLLLVAAGSTKRRDIELASERLTAVGAPLVGLVFVGYDANRGILKEQTRAQMLHSQRSEQTDHEPAET